MDTPLPPSGNLPPANPPAPPVNPLPAMAPAISGAVKTAGFFTTKIVAAIVGVVVVGGGIGIGYFVFPEPFYNSVGKYIGLPAPASNEERATAEEKPLTEEAAAEEKSTVLPVGASGLFDALPGADANIAAHVKISAEARGIVEEFNKKLEAAFAAEEKSVQDSSGTPSMVKELSGGRSRPIPLRMFGVNEENEQIFSMIEEIAFAGKQDFSSSQRSAESFQEQSLAFAIKVKADQMDAFAEVLKKADEKEPGVTSIENKGDGLFVIRALKNPLQGNFTDNPMYQNIASAGGDLAVAFNAKEAIAGWVEQNTPSEEELAADPNVSKQFELMKSVESLALMGSLQKDDLEKNMIVSQIRIGMDNEQHAAEGLAFIQPQLAGMLMFLPPDFQPFVKIDFSQESSMVNIHATVSDIEMVGQKIVESLSGPSEALPKPMGGSSPDLPLLNQPDARVLDGKVPRKKN